ncbi:MAG: ParA family protein [Myxococcota bacterium]
MPSFDHVLPTLLRVVAPSSLVSRASRICVVRDLLGRVRLAVEPGPGVQLGAEVDALQTELAAELGGYYVPPIVHPQSARLRHFVVELFKHARAWPSVWPSEYAPDVVSPPSRRIDTNKWFAFERALSKHSWLYEHRYAPPWPLHPRAPTIVAFYSFKGGVGRTTLLGMMAWQLVRAGKKVVVVDLDLEAPGAASLFGVEPHHGVVDYIVDRVAARTGAAQPWPAARSLGPADSAQITVVPAGHLNWQYLEKLARLDFAGSRTSPEDDGNPTLEALKSLLRDISRDYQPDYILIDSRAGLHDISGLSLHALSHLDVLVNRAGVQGMAGLALILQSLRQHKELDELQCIVVHAMAPGPNQQELRRQEVDRVRGEVYDLFTQHVYAEDDALDIDDSTAPHYPWVVSFDPRLERVERLGAGLEGAIFGSEELQQICSRIRELAGESSDEDDDGIEERAP